MAVSILRLSGNQIKPYLDDVARLRIEVFRHFPYLYDGNMDYERKYLETYARSQESLFVLALDGESVVGAATGIPMDHETNEFKGPFIEQGYEPGKIFYFGESVLLPNYRGQGVGVAFFEHREGYARELGCFTHCCFCAVERPANHPLRPSDYQPLDSFWQNRGYRKEPELATTYTWKDVGQTEETSKPMTFWLRRIA